MSRRSGAVAVRALLLLALALGVPSCKKEDFNTPGPSFLTGRFLDSPVAGLRWTIGTRSGTTDANGNYPYLPGDTVVFSIGDTTFPPVPAAPSVSPLSIFGTDDFNDVRVLNLSRLLQTLDSDGNAANGIVLDPAAHAAATGVAPFDCSSGSFDTDPAIASLLATGGGGTVLIPGAQAVAHLQSQVLVGSWYFLQAPGLHSSAVITFFATGDYFMAEDGDPGVDPSGQDGMERGTYTWNPVTGAFTATTTVDTTGQWGLSHPQGAITVTISGDILSYTDNSGTANLNRLNPSAASAIVGSWYILQAPGLHGSAVVTFFASGDYFMAEDGNPAVDPNGQDGMERGTYTWNPGTGAFTSVTTVDTTLQWGLSHPQGAVTMTVVGDTLNYTDNSGTSTFTRLRP